MMRLQQQRGITLIELMVAGVLGVIITYFIFNIMITSTRTATQADGLAQAQENGRFVTSWLHGEIRRAGYTPDFTDPRIQPFANTCASGAPIPPANNGHCSFNSNNADSDRIAIRRTYTTATTPRDRQDCTGVDLSSTPPPSPPPPSPPPPPPSDGDVLVDVYWVEPDTSADPDNFSDVLRCVTYLEITGIRVAPAQVIANGVQGFQVLYGESTTPITNNRTNVTRYVNADEVTNWNNVYAARISVLTRSFLPTGLDQATRSYVLLDANPYTFDDRIARHIQGTTIYLPNQ